MEEETLSEEEYKEALKTMIAQQLAADSNYRFSIDAKEAIEKAGGKAEQI